MSPRLRFEKEAFFQVPLTELLKSNRRDFPLFIYLKENDHLILRCRSAEEVGERDLQVYLEMGLQEFWCPKEFEDRWKARNEPLPSDLARSEESADAIDIMTSRELNQEEKVDALKEISRKILATLGSLSSKDEREQRDVLRKCREFSQDIMKTVLESGGKQSFFDQIMLVSQAEVAHSAAVPSFTVIFAMALGYIDPEVLLELSLGAVFHDVGMIKLNPGLIRVPEAIQDKTQRQDYTCHPAFGLEVLEKNRVELSAETKRIIEEHHEAFDGSGFPKGIKGYAIAETVQIVSLADGLDDLMTGRWDGKKRAPAEAVRDLRGLRPRFHPETFETIMQAIESGRAEIDHDESIREGMKRTRDLTN